MKIEHWNLSKSFYAGVRGMRENNNGDEPTKAHCKHIWKCHSEIPWHNYYMLIILTIKSWCEKYKDSSNVSLPFIHRWMLHIKLCCQMVNWTKSNLLGQKKEENSFPSCVKTQPQPWHMAWWLASLCHLFQANSYPV
jgi:hypothetical protein